ncbi:MAG TPA: restriction endonuclease subunit S [Chitinispirillaceae bacterium]|nr:restriction endonuclease subunit S [Chitinispirillaceae bacterium]
MKSKPLGSLCHIIAGQSPDSTTYNSVGNGLPFFQGKADFQEMYPNVRVWCSSEKRKEALPGDILISVRAPVGAVNICNSHAIIGRGLSALRAQEDLEVKYLYYYLKANERQIDALGTGSTFKAITQDTLKKIQIPLPPLADQKRIAFLLGKVKCVIAKRKEHLKLLDELLKSVFLEMFGDPVRNEKGWDSTLIQHLCVSPKDIKCGPFGTQLNKSEFQKVGVPVWGIPQINSNFAIPPNDFVTEEKSIQLEEYSVVQNDIVMSRKGTVGKCSLYPKTLQPGIMHSDVLRIRANWTQTNPTFLCYQLRISRDVESQIANVSSGAIMAGINVGKLKSITVFTPPIDLQNRFAANVEKITSLKAHYQKSLNDLKNLYGALSQKAFKGELDLSRVKY